MSRINRKLKISLIVAGCLVVLSAGAVTAILLMSKQSVSDYRSAAAKQLNNVIAGSDAGATVELRQVWFGGQLDSNYHKADGLQSEYAELLNSVKSYISLLNIHNSLVSQYNEGLKSDSTLSGDFLKIVNKYASLLANNFPDEKARLAAMQNLSKEITSNVEFKSISADADDVLSDNETWLNELRETLNADVTDFQKKIN
jgi:hypothetical protein